MKNKMVLTILAFFFLFIAGLIYLCFRPNTLLLFRWLDFIGFNYYIFQNIDIKLPSFFIYNFSNALFLLFGYIIIYVIWDKNIKHYLFYISLITFLNIVYEIITNDIEDIIAICITFMIFLLVYFKYYGVNNET